MTDRKIYMTERRAKLLLTIATTGEKGITFGQLKNEMNFGKKLTESLLRSGLVKIDGKAPYGGSILKITDAGWALIQKVSADEQAESPAEPAIAP